MLTDLPLARSTIDTDDERRGQPQLLSALAADPTTRVALVHRGLLATGPGGLQLWRPTELPPLSWEPGHAVYLGRDDEAAYVALVLPAELGRERDLDGVPIDGDARAVTLLQRTSFNHLRDIGDQLSDRDAGLATTAVALAGWHERNARCPRCGGATEVFKAGWERRCTIDGRLHYPRTDPAVIMSVIDDDDRILLGHAGHWPAHRFSTLAGYVEPGESLESAVRREVWEETSIRIGDLDYRGSQPWPFPCSLMMAYRAYVLPGSSTDVVVDGHEITEARFFTRAELGDRAADGRVVLPHRSSIARALIEEWFGQPLPRS